jgi:hypothetical protein
VTVTNGSAAVVPRQWTGELKGGPKMRAIGSTSSGVIFGADGNVNTFNHITQAAGMKKLGTAEQAQNIIMARAPNALVLELVGGKDLGKDALSILDLPNNGQGCPANTSAPTSF